MSALDALTWMWIVMAVIGILSFIWAHTKSGKKAIDNF